MSQPPSPFSLGVPAQSNPFAKAVKSTVPAFAPAPITTSTGASSKRGNPFLSAMNSDSKEFKDSYGINKPLKEAMFLGYRDEQPVFAGSKLFILY